MMSDSIPLVCNLTVFTDEEREQHMHAAQQLFSKVQSVSQDNQGYHLQLPDEDGIVVEAAQFIADDRKCCPFIQFVLEVKGSVVLHLNGDDDVQTMILGELLHLLPDDLVLEVAPHENVVGDV